MNYSSAFDNAPTGNGNANNGKPPSGLDAFDTAKPYEPLPAGIHQVRVVSGSFTQTKQGTDAYRVVFEVTDGEHRGRRVSRTWVFTEKAIGYAKRDLAAFGLTTGKQLLEQWPPLGSEVYCRLIVAIQRGDNGSEFNDVKKIDSVRTVDSTAKPFLIDPEADKSEGGSP